MEKIISYGPEEPNFGALGLMNNLRDEVLGTELLFKAGNMSVGHGNGFRYGLVQCTRDINSTQCGNCLKILIEKVQDCCQARTEFRIISPSCNLRYANYSLIQEASAPVLPPLPTCHHHCCHRHCLVMVKYILIWI